MVAEEPERAQPADAADDPEEEDQRVPLRLLEPLEDVQRSVGTRHGTPRARLLASFPPPVEIQHGEPGVEARGRDDGADEDPDDDERAGLELPARVVVAAAGLGRGRGQLRRRPRPHLGVHRRRGHEPAHERGREQFREVDQPELPALPHHERCEVPERRERAAGVCRHDDVDAARGHELAILLRRPAVSASDERAHDRAHERRGQRDQTGDPEARAVGEPGFDEPRSDGVEDVELLHRVHERHRDEEEEEYLHELGEIMPRRAGDDLHGVAFVFVPQGDEEPYRARREGDGNRLLEAAADALLGDRRGVADDEDDRGEDAVDRARHAVRLFRGDERGDGAGVMRDGAVERNVIVPRLTPTREVVVVHDDVHARVERGRHGRDREEDQAEAGGDGEDAPAAPRARLGHRASRASPPRLEV
eukprot:29243-Pelagococcus_subviridis.AAC.10